MAGASNRDDGSELAMSTAVRERRKFFERPEEPRALRITARDIALLQNIARFRLVSAAQLARSLDLPLEWGRLLIHSEAP